MRADEEVGSDLGELDAEVSAHRVVLEIPHFIERELPEPDTHG
jgi:hypothetical protein